MAIILRCPKCKSHFEENDDALKRHSLKCSSCDYHSSAENFAIMMFCPGCRSKLAIPLDMLKNKKISCPRCSKPVPLMPTVSLDDDDDNEIFAEQDDEKDTFKAGDFFDKYEIIKLLGKGGMGEVYLARHLLLHREVALKIMMANIAAKNPVFAKRFIREAKIANKIESPNIISVFDVGIDSKTETLFIAMEYVKGVNISEMIKARGVFNERETLKIILAVLNALASMEEQKIVHRDIKPSNIMINVNGEIKLADLGIAKFDNHAEGELTLTQDNVVFGTPNYASPEQCRASHNVDTRSDIYSLGATMFHMVAGYPPYVGESAMDTMLKVLNEPPANLENLKLDLSPGFIELINCMLKKDPDQRPQTIGDLKIRIEKILKGDCEIHYQLKYFVKDTVKKLKDRTVTVSELPSLFWKHFAKIIYRRMTITAIICAVLFFIIFAGFRNREYLRNRFKSLVTDLESAPVKQNNKPVYDLDSSSADSNNSNEINFNRTKLYENSKKKQATEKSDITGKSDTKKQPENQTADTPPPVDSIAGRIIICKKLSDELLEKKSSAPETPMLDSRIKFVKNYYSRLLKQAANRRYAAAASEKADYDESAAVSFQRIYRKLSKNPNQLSAEFDRLLDLLKNPKFNPNIKVEDLKNPDKPVPLINAVLTGNVIPDSMRNNFVEALIRLKVDTTPLANEIFSNAAIINYGIDNLDGRLIPALKNKDKKFAQTLILNGANVNVADSDGNSVLHLAMYCNDFTLIKYIIAAGADVNAVNKTESQTPLFYAEKYASLDIVDLMLKANSNADFKDIYGKKAVDYRFIGEFNRALQMKNIKKLDELFDKYPELVNAELADGSTPLQYACTELQLPLVKLLLNKYADTEKITALNPVRPIQMVYRMPCRKYDRYEYRKALEIFKELLEKNADFKCGPYGIESNSLLHYSLRHLAENDMDSEHFYFIAAMLEKIDTDSELPSLLEAMYKPFSVFKPVPANKNKINNEKLRYALLKELLDGGKDLSASEFKHIFAYCGGNINVTFNELNLLIKNNADISSTDPEGRNALFHLCLAVSENSDFFNDSNNLDAACDRAEFLLYKNIKTAPDTNDISNMKLHPDFEAIPGIKNLRRKHGK